MAEFLTQAEADQHYGSKSKANAGLTLGIIGTALAALGGGNGLFGGNGILGMGYNNGAATAAALGGGAAAMAAAHGMDRTWQLERQESNDQQADVYMIQQAKIDALRELGYIREKDVAEKADIYRQTKVDNNVLQTQINENKDYTTNGLVDLYKVQNNSDKQLYQAINDTRYQGMINAKELELKMDAHREIDVREKFDMYKDLNDQTNRLAFNTMKQSYEDRMEAFNHMANLSNRISALETATAVNKATQPLLFQLQSARTDAELNTKITGNLGIKWDQIYGPNPVPPCCCPCNS